MKKTDFIKRLEFIWGWDMNNKMILLMNDIAKSDNSENVVIDKWRQFQKSEKGHSPYLFKKKIYANKVANKKPASEPFLEATMKQVDKVDIF